MLSLQNRFLPLRESKADSLQKRDEKQTMNMSPGRQATHGHETASGPENKFQSVFHPDPFQVTAAKGTMITAQRDSRWWQETFHTSIKCPPHLVQLLHWKRTTACRERLNQMTLFTMMNLTQRPSDLRRPRRVAVKRPEYLDDFVA